MAQVRHLGSCLLVMAADLNVALNVAFSCFMMGNTMRSSCVYSMSTNKTSNSLGRVSTKTQWFY